jgi:YidC/Oxa1 family membrane protein insertase
MHFVPILAENALFKDVGDIFHPLFIAIATVLAAIYSVVHDYTASIVILTVLIMAVLTPLTVKSTRSMMAMQTLQPELQKLKKKYPGAENREALNAEMMRLYRENGVSPTGGCLPMFLQMPALIVLYDVIKGLANTVVKGTKLGTGKKCIPMHGFKVCATPRYIPHSSAMYKNLIKSPGVMKSIGLNLATKPLSHHAHWFDYIPYLAMVLMAVGLQYLQMSMMTKRNKKNPNAAQVPQQMQTMQKFFPLIFAYIYLLVPAGVVIYMIVSSAIRVGTQDVMYRFGFVKIPGAGERKIAGAKPSTAALPAGRGASGGGGMEGTGTRGNGSGGPRKPSSGPGGPRGPRPPGGPRPSGSTGSNGTTGSNGSRTNGRKAVAPPPEEPVVKAHPRSRSKRERKAR